MNSSFKRITYISVTFFSINVITVNAMNSAMSNPGNSKDHMDHFLSAIDSKGQIEAIEGLSETIAFTEMVPQNVLVTLDGTKQENVKKELAKAKNFLKCLLRIARNAQNDLYTNREMIFLCNKLTKMRSKLILNDLAGSVNVELVNLTSVLQCGITYRILSDPNFTDYDKLTSFSSPNYTAQLLRHIYGREDSCSLNGIHDKEAIFLNAVNQKYPNVINEYRKKKEKTNELSLQDMENLYLYYITEGNGEASRPFENFNGMAFAANYVTIRKQISTAKLAVLFKKIEKEEVVPYKIKLRFENEFFDQISEETTMLYSDLLSEKGQDGMMLDILFEIRQNIATRGDHLLGLVYARCSEFSKDDIEKKEPKNILDLIKSKDEN